MKASRPATPVAILSAFQLLASFAIYAILLGRYSAGSELDAFIAGQTLPLIALSIITAAVSNILVPLLVGSPSPTAYRQSLWDFTVIFSLAIGLISGILYAFADLALGIVFDGFTAHQIELTRGVLNFYALIAVLMMARAAITADFHARKKFVLAEALLCTAVTASCFVIYFLPATSSVVTVAQVILLREGLLLAAMLPLSRLSFHASVTRQSAQTAWRRIWPLLGGASLHKYLPIVERSLLSLAPEGTLAVFTLAQQAFAAVNTVLGRALVAPQLPRFSQMIKDGKIRECHRAFSRHFTVILVGATMSVIALALVLLPVLHWQSIALESLNISVMTMSIIFLALLPHAPASVAGSLAMGPFYAFARSDKPAQIGVISAVLGACFRYAGFAIAGVFGLAAGITLQYLIMTALARQWAGKLFQSYSEQASKKI